MSKTSFEHIDCSIAQSLDVIGEWWSLLILSNAFHGVRSFDDFQKQLGISTNVLTQRLKKMTDDGIFTKVQSKSDGRSFEYRLTDKGLDLYPIIVALHDWGEKWKPSDNGPRMVLNEKRTGKPIAPIRVFSVDGEELTARDVKPQAGPGADIYMQKLISRQK